MTKVLEIAVYELNKDVASKGVDTVRRKMNESLSKYPGFISAMTFRDLNQENTLLDYSYWATLEQATEAVKTFKSDPDAADYINKINKVIHFGHYYPEDDEILQASDFGRNSVLEFAIGEIKKESLSSMREIKPKLFKVVKEQKGLNKITGAKSSEDKTLMLDGICWNDMSDLSNAMDVIHKEEVCRDFMETFKEDIYFGQLKLA